VTYARNDLPHVSRSKDLRARLLAGHMLLAEHAFYPLTLCTLLCFAFLATRWARGAAGYSFLVWNLFLAWVPYFLALAAVRLTEVKPQAKLTLASIWAAWLLMLPNAPYLFTDLIHWRNRPREMPWWFDLGLILMFGLAGCFAGIVSLRIMHDLVRRAYGFATGWAFVTVVALLSGFGIYLGRFERWNSWDLLTHPHRIASQIVFKAFNPYLIDRTLGVTLMFGAMILATYVMFVSVQSSTRRLGEIRR
jgi:uncharacterized membrane protein